MVLIVGYLTLNPKPKATFAPFSSSFGVQLPSVLLALQRYGAPIEL